MRRPPIVLAVAIVTTLAAGAVPGGTALAAPPGGVAPPGGGSGGAGGRGTTITLITGDVVTVMATGPGCPQVSVAPAARHRVLTRTCRPDGHLLVVPADAAPMLGRALDPALFDVTELLADGYDDAHTAQTPLIVQYADAGAAHRAATGAAASGGAAARGGGGLGGRLAGRRPLASIRAVAGGHAKTDGAALRELLPTLRRTGTASGVTRILLDRRVRATPLTAHGAVDTNLTQVGAPAAWAAGYTGAGVRVAVLDTGIDATHPDLVGKVVDAADFTQVGDGGTGDVATGLDSVVDGLGHGTHVAATIAGTGAASAGRHRGVAPDAQLVIGRVLDADGSGTDSGVIAGMEWAASRSDVVNLSLGGFFPDDGTDPTALAVDALTAQYGTLFVIAAGNAGPGERTVSAPGSAAAALTVGAVDATDTVAGFSSRGPLAGTGVIKPEIVAPGVDIVSARATGTAMGRLIDARYTAASGTSMATPHVAGAAALLRQAHPDRRAAALKPALTGAAAPATGGDAHTVGAGRLDVAGALAGPVSTTATADLGTLAWPQHGQAATTLGWANPSATATSLTLAVTAADRNGRPLPAGAVRCSTPAVALPAGGTGSAQLVVDRSRLGDISGFVVATVTATDPGGRRLHTPVSFAVDGPAATLTLRATAIPGTADGAFSAMVNVISLDDPYRYAEFFPLSSDEPTVLRVPAGRYSVLGEIDDANPDGQRVALVGDPDVTVAGDTGVLLDGAAARQVGIEVEGVATEQLAAAVGYTQRGPRDTIWGTAAYVWSDVDWGPSALLVAPIPGVRTGTFRAERYASLDQPGDGPSPYLYDLIFTAGSFEDAPVRVVTRAEQAGLARVEQRFLTYDTEGSVTGHKRYGLTPEGFYLGENATNQVGEARTDYLTPGLWLDEAFFTGLLEYPEVIAAPVRSVTAGGVEHLTWNRQPLHTDWLESTAPALSDCQPDPVRRTSGNLHVWLTQLVDAHGRYDCVFSDVPDRRLALYRDGKLLGEAGEPYADFALPRRRGDYRLTYDLSFGTPERELTQAVSTAWTFRSAGPASDASVPVPLLSLDYALPMGPGNRPVGDLATVTVRQMPGTTPQRVLWTRVQTSVDDGQTWQQAPVAPAGGGRFTVRLPQVAAGTTVSLRVHALADGGSGIEQTMIRAYHG